MAKSLTIPSTVVGIPSEAIFQFDVYDDVNLAYHLTNHLHQKIPHHRLRNGDIIYALPPALRRQQHGIFVFYENKIIPLSGKICEEGALPKCIRFSFRESPKWWYDHIQTNALIWPEFKVQQTAYFMKWGVPPGGKFSQNQWWNTLYFGGIKYLMIVAGFYRQKEAHASYPTDPGCSKMPWNEFKEVHWNYVPKHEFTESLLWDTGSTVLITEL